MKFFLVLFALYAIFGSLFGSSFMPFWWDNPHAALLNVNQTKLYKKESTVKPDLTRIKENLYMPFESNIEGQKYYGMITVKPQNAGQIKIGGAVYRNRDTDALGLLEGQLVDKKTYYEIHFSSKNASQLFKSQTRYQEKTDLPAVLEIRSVGNKNAPYILPPTVESKRQFFRFLPVLVDVEKPYLGKWSSSSISGDWDFEISPLPGNQLTGISYYTKPDGSKCGYPLFGFPVGRNEILLMTGESSMNSAECKTFAWISNSGQSSGLYLDPMNPDDFSLTLIKK